MRPEPGRAANAARVYSGARRFALGLVGCGLLALTGVAIAEESGGRVAVPVDPAAIGIAQPDMAAPWLDEVRAQREAWEARRSAVREQHGQRRRLHHPRGAAQQEDWEEDLRRRRAERQERIDQDREVFRRLGPSAWGLPPPFAEGESEVSERPESLLHQPPPISPPGWDNLWYFRGY